MAIVKVYAVRGVNLHADICVEIHAQRLVQEDVALLAHQAVPRLVERLVKKCVMVDAIKPALELVCILVMVAVFIQVHRLRIQYYKVSIRSSFDAWKNL